jgi:4-amino-4-deoxy-L-arabinose transferase-like glycosyltransferase
MKLTRPQALCVAAISLIALALRLYRLGEVPPGLFFDEMAVGLNALLIAQTGLDQYGHSFPVLFRALDDYKGSLFIYSLAALLKFVPPTEWSIRFPAVLWGLATVAATYKLTKQGTKSTTAALWAALFISMMPWHVHFSRISWEAITLPCLFALFLLFSLKLTAKPTVWLAALCGVLGGLMPYSYTPGKLIGAVSLVVLGVIVLQRRASKVFAVLALSAVITATPFILYYAAHHQAINLRFGDVALPLSEMPLAYISHFTPQFLFIRGDFNLRHNPQGGMLHWYEAVFLAVAVFGLLRGVAPYTRLLLLLLFALPLVSALSRDYPHATRLLVLCPVLASLSAVGAIELSKKLRIPAAAQLGLAAVLLVSTLPRWQKYFGPYNAESRFHWDADQMSVLRAAKQYVPVGEEFYAQSEIRYFGWMLLEPPSREELLVRSGELQANELRYDPLDAAWKFKFIRMKRLGREIPVGWSIISHDRFTALGEAQQQYTSYFENETYRLVHRSQ